MSKLIFALAASLFALNAHASSLMTSCHAWNYDKLSVDFQMMLVQEIGGNSDTVGVAPSILTAIQGDRILSSGDVFNHLDSQKSEGSFNQIDKKFYPVTGDGVKETTVKVRQLALKTVFKKEAPESLKSFSFVIEPALPDDATFVGEGTMNVDGVDYAKVSYNCIVYVDWQTFKGR